MVAGTQLTAAGGPGALQDARSASSKSSGPQSFVVQRHDAKTNNLMLIYPDFWHSWENTLVVLEPSVFPSEVSRNRALCRNAIPLKHSAVCSLSLECLPTSRKLLGLSGQTKHQGVKRGIPPPNNLLFQKPGFHHQRFISYWVMKHFCLLKF